MKRLWMLFSTIILGCGNSLGLISCKTHMKYALDEVEIDANQDLVILNKIKNEVKQTLRRSWAKKEAIDMNKYSDQITSFVELVATLQTEENALVFTNETIRTYHFFNELLNDFKTEFVDLNQSLRDRYSNYYPESMPLLLAEDDISFTMDDINFDNIAKLLEDTPEEIMGFTVQDELIKHFDLNDRDKSAEDFDTSLNFAKKSLFKRIWAWI